MALRWHHSWYQGWHYLWCVSFIDCVTIAFQLFLETQKIPEQPRGEVFWSITRTAGCILTPSLTPTLAPDEAFRRRDSKQVEAALGSSLCSWQTSVRLLAFRFNFFWPSELIPTFALDLVQLANLYRKPRYASFSLINPRLPKHWPLRRHSRPYKPKSTAFK